MCTRAYASMITPTGVYKKQERNQLPNLYPPKVQYCNLLSGDLKSPEHLARKLEFLWHRCLVSLEHGNQLAVQGLLGESKWRRPVCLVSMYQFLVFRCENVVLGICNTSRGNY